MVGNRLNLLCFSYILTIDTYQICSRFIAFLLCLKMLNMVVSSHNYISKSTKHATLFDWRGEICLSLGGEIITTSYSLT